MPNWISNYIAGCISLFVVIIFFIVSLVLLPRVLLSFISLYNIITVYSGSEYNSLVDNAASSAIDSNSTSPCESLPTHIRYNATGPHGDIIGVFGGYPRAGCLLQYYYESNDAKACEILMDLSKAAGDRCYSYIAEVKSDPSLCDKTSPTYILVDECKYNAELGWKRCYEHESDDPDEPYNIARCIGEVVDKTKDYSGCLAIDGPDYGEEWMRERNKCLWNAMIAPTAIPWTRDVSRIGQWLCQYMLQEEGHHFSTAFGDVDECIELQNCLRDQGTDIMGPACNKSGLSR